MKKSLRILLLAYCIASNLSPAQAQLFGTENELLLDSHMPQSIHTSDLDNDGDKDMLLAATSLNELLWYENLGDGDFGPQQVIASVGLPVTVFTEDLNGDGLEDILSANFNDDNIIWIENLGSGNFGPVQILSTALNGAYMIYTVDLDNDADPDVVSASWPDDKLAWYENLGGGNFGPQQIISTTGDGVISVHPGDFDNDGCMDLVAANFWDDNIVWYRNLGDGTFGSENFLGTANSAYDVYAGDLDGDGDEDIVGVSSADSEIYCFENTGGGSFTRHIVSTNVSAPHTIFCADLDNDGDMEIISADHAIASGHTIWFENLGGLVFSAKNELDGLAKGVYSVHADDLDNDGDLEILMASYNSSKLAWYENLSPQSCAYDPVYLTNTYLTAPGGSSTIQLNWQNIPDAFAYKIKISRVDGGAPKFKHFITSSNSLSIPGNFMSGEKYRWKVRAACSSDTTNWSLTKAFEIPELPAVAGRSVPISANASTTTAEVSLIPNPATETISFRLPTAEAVKLTIVNTAGILVFSQLLEGGETQIDLRDWDSGTYFYQTKIGGELLTGSFIKNR